jgi:uncharacterized protein Yka (UPF0111/DUF47 family)
MSEITSRFDRIEKKLDEVGEAIVLLARIDERLVAQAEQSQRLGQRQEKIEDRVDRLEHSRSKLLGASALLVFSGTAAGQGIEKFIQFLIG